MGSQNILAGKLDFDTILAALTVPTFILDAQHRVVTWNQACEMLTGLKAEDIIGTTEVWRGFYPSARPCLADIVIDGTEAHDLEQLYPCFGVAKFSKGLHAENWFENLNGKRRYLIFEAQPIFDDTGAVIAVVQNLEDITEIKHQEEELTSATAMAESGAEFLRVIISTMVEGFVLIDDRARIMKFNPACTAMFGYSREEVLGQNVNMLMPEPYHSAHDEYLANYISTGTKKIIGIGREVVGLRKDGSVFPMELSVGEVHHNNERSFIGIIRDITERKEAEEKIRELAFYDSLTQLPNRRMLIDRLELALSASARSGQYGALLFLDLDKFKELNDARGHIYGDMLLIEVARRLKAGVREGDTVARQGGDEFVVMLVNLGQTIEQAHQQVSRIGNKLVRSLNQPYVLSGYTHHSSSSVGATLFRGRESSIETLIQQADHAMYQAKNAGRNTMRFFDAEKHNLNKPVN